jgi:hypothetical protein
MDVETARRKLDKAETAYRARQQLAFRCSRPYRAIAYLESPPAKVLQVQQAL